MPFSRRSWLPVLCLFGPLFLFVNFVKIWKVRAITNHWSVHLWFDMVRWDWVLMLALSLGFLVFLESATGFKRRAMLGFLAVATLTLLVLTAVEHGFFLITGTPGDWLLLKYGLMKLTDKATLQVFINQAMGPKFFLLVLPFALVFGPLLWMRRNRTREWIQQGERVSKDAPAWMYWGTPILLCVLLLLPVKKLPGDLKTSSNNFVWFLFKGMTNDLFFKKNIDIRVSDKLPPLFDARNLRLQRTLSSPKRNVVYILLESIRARSITPYNKKLKTTPFLDQLAKKSWQVNHMSAILPHTSKALVPTLCGIFPKVTQPIQEGNVQGIPSKCLASLLNEQGYNTAFFQSATVGFEKRAQLVANMGYKVLKGHEDMNTRGWAKTNYFGYEDRMMLKPSLKWIDKQNRKPFFLTYLLLVSHHTYTTPKKFKLKEHTQSKDPELNKYLNSIRYVDGFLKDLFAGFKKRGLLKKTIFVFVGDHGEAFSEHKRRQHDNIMWDEGLHIPALIYAPGLIDEHKSIKGRRTQVDLLPTVTKMLGYELKGGRLPGVPLQKDVSKQRETFHSCWYQNQCMALRRGDFKYIYHYNRRPWEVYNLVKDPFEKKNLAYTGRFKRPMLKKIERKLLEWKARVNRDYNRIDSIRRKRGIRKTVPKVAVKVGVRLGKYARVVGYTLHENPLRRGGTLDISMVFQPLSPIPRKRKLFFHINIKPPRGFKLPKHTKVQRFINADHITVGGTHPPHKWKKGTFVVDRHRVRIPGYFPPGSKVSLHIGFWARREKRTPLLETTKKHYDDGKRRLHVLTLPIRPASK